MEGNEEADRLAELGTKGEQKEIPITQAKVRKKRWTSTHNRAKTIFRDKLKPKLNIEKTWPRRFNHGGLITVLATKMRTCTG